MRAPKTATSTTTSPQARPPTVLPWTTTFHLPLPERRKVCLSGPENTKVDETLYSYAGEYFPYGTRKSFRSHKIVFNRTYPKRLRLTRDEITSRS